jgi:hypothetical protein
MGSTFRTDGSPISEEYFMNISPKKKSVHELGGEANFNFYSSILNV